MTLFWLGTGWLAGLALADIGPLLPLQWAALSLLAALALLWNRRHPKSRLLFGWILALTLAGIRVALSAHAPAPEALIDYNGLGQTVRLRGRIADLPEPEDGYTALTVAASGVRSPGSDVWIPLSGHVLARADPFTDWQYGDAVELTGELETPPVFEGFSYRQYLERRGIYSIMQVTAGSRLAAGSRFHPMVLLSRYRGRALSVIRALFPEPESSLLAGILLGLEGGIPEPVRTAFNRTGTTHIIAISGFNISIVAGLFLSLFSRWWGVRRGSWAAAGAIGAYTLLVGADPAVVRAALMALLALTAQRIGRQSDGYAALAAAAFIMTAFDPYVAWDAGFQLSYAATLGLLFYGNRMQSSFSSWLTNQYDLTPERGSRISAPIGEYLLLTLAAQVTTLPLMLYYFGRLPLLSPLANALILPAQPATMVLSGLAALAGTMWRPVGQPLAWLAWPFPAFTIRVVERLAALPMASLALPPLSLAGLVALYALIAAATLLLLRTPKQAKGAIPTSALAAGLAALALATLLLWQSILHRPDGKLRMTVLDVTQGQAILIRTGAGRNLLINGGASSLDLGNALDRRLSIFHRSLDWVVVTDTSEEAIGGIAELADRYAIGGLLVAADPQGAAYSALVDTVQADGTTIGYAADGMRFDLGRGVRLGILDLGAPGFALLLESPSARWLLAPGAGSGWTSSLPIEVRTRALTGLLLPGAADASRSPADQVMALRPWVMLASVGDGAARGLPSTSLIEAFAGHNFLRTDRDGWIEITLADDEMRVETGRAAPLGAAAVVP
jgi:competence protein ComEC